MSRTHMADRRHGVAFRGRGLQRRCGPRNGLLALGLSLAAGFGSAQEATPPDLPPTLMEENRLVPIDAAGMAAAGQRTTGGDSSFAAAATSFDAEASNGLFGSAEAAALAAGLGIAAGRTPGSFSVTSTGAASYRIPLWTPPGVGAVKLDLALVYNSRGGNGVLGQGWALSGLSAISRCNRTWTQDGAAAPVAYVANDRYCLDGRQLKLVSGVAGTDGAVYATEIEAFSRVVASGSAGSGPASFTVTTKCCANHLMRVFAVR